MLFLVDTNHRDALNDMIAAADKGLSLTGDNTKVMTGHGPGENAQETDDH